MRPKGGPLSQICDEGFPGLRLTVPLNLGTGYTCFCD
ncbi:hypothetical protein P3T40_006625 [Paraburkholderia sp. EB58]|jgi:hypothetical protein